jgi:hypothetical protein
MKRLPSDSCTTFGQISGGTVGGRIDWSKCIAIALAILLGQAAGAADQWSNPLIGEWQGVMHSADQYNLPFDIKYSADGTFVSSVALPGQRDTNAGSGMMFSRGRWSMTGPHSIQLIFTESKSCAAGVEKHPPPAVWGAPNCHSRCKGRTSWLAAMGLNPIGCTE